MMPRLSLLSFCFRSHEMRPYICRIVGHHLMVPGFLCEILRFAQNDRLRYDTDGGAADERARFFAFGSE